MEELETKRVVLVEKEDKELNEAFETVWLFYPRKQGKKMAKMHFRKLLKEYTIDQILDAVTKFAEEYAGTPEQYIVHGDKFFHTRIYDYIENLPTLIKVFNRDDDLYRQLLKEYKKMDYADYLNTEHWRYFREQVLKYHNHKCQICDSISKLSVHHKNYENMGRETFNDVILICDSCHKKIHEIKGE